MAIPAPGDRSHWEIVRGAIAVTREVHGLAQTFLVTPTRRRWVHPCSIDDLVAVLSSVPADFVRDLEAIVLCQPTRKQDMLGAAWGRYDPLAQVRGRTGAMVFLYACAATAFRMPRPLDAEDRAELDRLAAEGHQVTEERRHYRVERTHAANHATVLEYTLLHEIGHHVDYRLRVALPGGDDLDAWAEANERYWSRPRRERDAYAHRIAVDLAAMLRERGVLPRPAGPDPASLIADGLDPSWFDRTTT